MIIIYYGDIQVAYIDAPDAATRARALQASIYVYDWINQPNDGPSIDALKKASADPDTMVKRDSCPIQRGFVL